MRDNIQLETYKLYLIDLKDMIFKILPLVEEDNEYVKEYIELLTDEVTGLREEIEFLPHRDWYVRTLSFLRVLEKMEDHNEKDKKRVKKIVFKMLNAIDKQLDKINEGV